MSFIENPKGSNSTEMKLSVVNFLTDTKFLISWEHEGHVLEIKEGSGKTSLCDHNHKLELNDYF